MSDHPTQADPAATAPARDLRSRRRWLLVSGLAVVGLLALALSWYLGRATPDAVDTQAAIDAADVGAAATDGAEGEVDAGGSGSEDLAEDPTDGEAEGGSEEGTQPGGLPAGWIVDPDLVDFDFDAGTGSFLGFRIDEELSTVGATTAVGRTPEVEGRLLLVDGVLDTASVTGDLTALTTDISQRDRRAQQAMNTGTFPTSTFELTEPVDLGSVPAVGETLQIEATGELTLNGVTREMPATIEAVLLDAERLLVTGDFEVVLSDFDLVAPSAPIVVRVADSATIEFQLYLSPAQPAAAGWA